MKRSTLTATIAIRTGITADVADQVLASFSEALLETASSGDTFTWPGLFTLDVVHRPGRAGRNPRTGEPLQIPAVDRPRLRAGTRLTSAARQGDQ